MFIFDNRAARNVVIAVLVLLLIPLVIKIGMIMMGGHLMTISILLTLLVAALIFLYLLTTGSGHRRAGGTRPNGRR